MTNEEMNLIAMVRSGALDGLIGRNLVTNSGATVWTSIKDGVIRRYKQGVGSKFIYDNEKKGVVNTELIEWEWRTDKEILLFLRENGWLMSDPDVQEYSLRFLLGK